MKCPKCRRNIEGNSVYCEYCGAQVKRVGVLNRLFASDSNEVKSALNQTIDGNTIYLDDDFKVQFLHLTVEPEYANVFIDGEPKTIIDGELTVLLPYGKHDYNIEAPKCIFETGEFVIGEKPIEKKVFLLPNEARLCLTCDDSKAELFINECFVGNGSWIGGLDPGIYLVEAKKADCDGNRKIICLRSQQEIVVELSSPQPKCGSITVTSTPEVAQIYLNGDYVGTTPFTINNLQIGLHQLEIKKKGYYSDVIDVDVKEDAPSYVSVVLKEFDASNTNNDDKLAAGISLYERGLYADSARFFSEAAELGCEDAEEWLAMAKTMMHNMLGF